MTSLASEIETSRNLRHLRVFLAVAELGSLTLASDVCNVSQPAVTQAINKLEASSGGALFVRTRQGVFLQERGEVLAKRVRRAFDILDPTLIEVSPRLPVTVTFAQLRALIAVSETGNFTLAAGRLGLSQPTVHRAISQLESVAERRLFRRSSSGLVAVRAAQDLALAARLALTELKQADADVAEFDGAEAGEVVVGTLPLARSVLLPRALAQFRDSRPTLPVQVVDGIYNELLSGLRRGEIDMILGALRDPVPVSDVVQEALFDDYLAFVVRPDHPLVTERQIPLEELVNCKWVLPRKAALARQQFDAYFEQRNIAPPQSVIEAGSMLLLREMINAGDFIGCISGLPAEVEIANGLMARVDVAGDWPGRAIGITSRAGWIPTQAQSDLLQLLRQNAKDLHSL